MELPEGRFNERLKAPCAAAQLPLISRSLSDLCQASSPTRKRTVPKTRGEWVGGAQRWRFRPKEEPERTLGDEPKTCPRAMHPLTASRWDAPARSAEDLELKKYGYHRNIPRTRGGAQSQSRLSLMVPPEHRANGESFDLPQAGHSNVRVSGFYQSYFLLASAFSPLPSVLFSSTANSRAAWALPDLNRELQISKGTDGQWAAGPPLRAPDLRLPDSGRCRSPIASFRSQWALRDARKLPLRSGSCRLRSGSVHARENVRIDARFNDRKECQIECQKQR
eukprot:s404_g13.t1